LARKEQVMILLNRRGYSPFGAVPRLRQDARMQELRDCHDASTSALARWNAITAATPPPVPQKCVHCGSEYVYFLARSLEKLEELLHACSPQRGLDGSTSDTVRGKGDFESVLNTLRRANWTCWSVRR